MLKRFLSFLVCFALLIGSVPTLTVGARSNEKASAKLGIENGDTVMFAGKNNTPIKWRVVNKDKSNTDSSDGILLLSEDTLINVESPANTIDWTVDACNAFYNSNFKNSEKSAVMTVSKTDEVYNSGGFSFKGSLPAGTAVFALSASELNSLSSLLKKFDGSEKCFLRSVSEGYVFMYSYSDSAGNFAIKSIAVDPRANFKIRPAVNLKKSKLASLDEKPLLLPAGEFSEANNKLVSLGAASEWKLTSKNDNVAITQTYTNIKSDKDYTLTVGTNLENADGDDYISLIVKKGDGSISHYGRYAMTSSEKSVDFTLPDGFDKTNDSVYAFYENYNGTMSGSASSLTKVCLEHEPKYTQLDKNLHRLNCKNCGYSKDENHTFKVIETDDERHSEQCTLCAYQATDEHTYSETIGTAETDFKCSVCERTAPFTAIENDFGNDVAAVRDEYVKGSAKIYQDNGKYIGDPEKGIFSDENSVEIVSDGIAKLTFNTNKAVKATGFKIITVENKYDIPGRITLYGRKNSLDDYTKIGTAVIKSILPVLSDRESYSGKTYSFLFANTAQSAAYSDYMLELSKNDFDGSNSRVQLKYFGLISEKKTNFSYNLDGAVIDGEPFDAVYPGEDLTFTAYSKNGHPKKEEITVSADKTTLDNASWSYSEEDGVFVLPGEYISNDRTYFLEIKCKDKTLSVEHELSGLTLSAGNKTAEFGSDYVCVFADSSGNTTYVPTSLENGDIKVYCGDTDITAKCDASSLGEGRLTISGKYVLGNLKIIAREKHSVQTESSQIKIERTGKPTRWYDNVADARADIMSGGDVTVTLLKDVNVYKGEGFVFNNGAATFDLNGHMINCRFQYEVPIEVNGNAYVTLKNGTIQSNGNYLACGVYDSDATLCVINVTVEPDNDLDYDYYIYIKKGKLIVNNDTDKTIKRILVCSEGKLEVKKGIIHNIEILSGGICKFSGGTVHNVEKLDDKLNVLKLNYNELLAEGYEFYDITSKTDFDAGNPTGFSVRCSHMNIDKDSGKCMGCDRRFLIRTVSGEKISWYDDIHDAIAYANENSDTTIKLFGDVTPDTEVTQGWLELTSGNTTLDLNGKSFTTAFPMRISGTCKLTVTGNGIMYTSIIAYEESDSHPLLTIENGRFSSVTGNLLLKGGNFVRINSQYPNSMLPNGKIFQGQDGNFFHPDRQMTNVTIADVPFKITKQPEGKLITDASAAGTISVEAEARLGYENDITYKWYERTAQYDEYWNKWRYTDIPLENETSAQLQLPKDLPSGTQKTYKCEVSCKGYVASTDYAMYTLGSKAPLLECDGDDEDEDEDYTAWVNGYGVDCVMVIEYHCQNKFIGKDTQKINAEDGLTRINISNYSMDSGADTVKIYLMDAAETTQISEAITLLRDNIMILCLNGTEYFAGSEGIDCVCIIASYKDGRLVDLVHMDINESNEYYNEVVFDAENSTEVKIFVLKDFQSMMPLRFRVGYMNDE